MKACSVRRAAKKREIFCEDREEARVCALVMKAFNLADTELTAERIANICIKLVQSEIANQKQNSPLPSPSLKGPEA